jgi:hypothetical protein
MRMNMTMSMRFSKNLRRGSSRDATPSEHRMRAPHSCITSSGSTSRPVSFNRENVLRDILLRPSPGTVHGGTVGGDTTLGLYFSNYLVYIPNTGRET